ncbi:hypothetical protein BgiBS90_002790 [Biomphalaria glabrata]|nr:hypothetical protein BgiBS90_002790 [Biomphalaria glabrata]
MPWKDSYEKSGSEAGSGVVSESGSGVGCEAGSGVVSESGSGVGCEAGSGAVSESGSGAGRHYEYILGGQTKFSHFLSVLSHGRVWVYSLNLWIIATSLGNSSSRDIIKTCVGLSYMTSLLCTSQLPQINTAI